MAKEIRFSSSWYVLAMVMGGNGIKYYETEGFFIVGAFLSLEGGPPKSESGGWSLPRVLCITFILLFVQTIYPVPEKLHVDMNLETVKRKQNE